MSTHNLYFEQKYEKNLNFLSENFHFLVTKISIYLNRLVFWGFFCVCVCVVFFNAVKYALEISPLELYPVMFNSSETWDVSFCETLFLDSTVFVVVVLFCVCFFLLLFFFFREIRWLFVKRSWVLTE